MAIALFERLPALREKLPHLPLGRFPTRVQQVVGLLPPAVELWVKREDDCAEAYGGNKVRKLEFLLAEARARGDRKLVTIGGWGSHHALATAVYGVRAGFAVETVLFPQPVTERVRANLLALAATGATLRPVTMVGLPLAIAGAKLAGGTAWIAAGGSSAVGTLGWVSAGLEIGAQVRAGELPPPDAVYAALGSCGTVAGLWLGLRMAGLAPRVVGVRVVDHLVSNATATQRLADATARLIVPHAPLPSLADAELAVDHRFFGPGYGHATPAAEAAIAEAARVGLVLEPTYTGKAFAALLADAAAGRLDRKRVLFIDTYNSVDLAPLLAKSPGPASLPPRLRRLFAR